MAKASEPEGDEPLKRLGGGRWETRDGRFVIEPASGTWSVVDAEETDDLGLPLVRGPFRSLTDAKAAIATARETAAPASPLADRVRDGPRRAPDQDRSKRTSSPSAASDPRGDHAEAEPAAAVHVRSTKHGGTAPQTTRTAGREREEDDEPGWLRDLSAADRGRARRLIDRLAELGIPAADSIVRRDVVGEVPAVAAAAIERRLAALPADAGIADVVDLLVNGRDDELGVRWRLVDGDGREILVDLKALRRARR